MGGESIELGLEGTLSLQPLARIDEPGEIAFALQWVTALLTSEGVRVTPDVKDAVWTALQSLASAPKAERTLTGLAVLIQSNALVAALAPYTLEGAYGRLLDGSSEQLAETDVLHFEMEQLMQHKALVAPVLTYLFHRLEARFDGRPTLLILDEAWTFLDDAAVRGPHPRVAQDAAQEERGGGVRDPVAGRHRALDHRAGADRELPDAHLPAQRSRPGAAGARPSTSASASMRARSRS